MKKINFKIKNIFFILLSVAILSWGIVYTNCGSGLDEISQNQNVTDPTQNDLSGPACLSGSNQNSSNPPAGCASMIATGGGNTCAVVNGGVKCWGALINPNGSVTTATSPVAIPNLSGVTAISMAGGLVCVIANGGVQCWGDNMWGEVGNGTTGGIVASPVPVKNANGTLLTGATAITVGADHACALLGSTAKCWGANHWGQLGTNNTINSNVAKTVVGLNNITAITAGLWGSCALLSNQKVKCWGANSHGELGAGPTAPISSLVPLTVVQSNGNAILATAIDGSSDMHTCAKTTTNNVVCWGSNDSGQLGVTGITTSKSAVSVPNMSNTTMINVGARHSCAVKSSGVMKCWGNNYQGQLGNGTTNPPVQPFPAPSTVLNVSNVLAMDAGSNHTCAIENGFVKCWGSNGYGELGNGSVGGNLPTPPVASNSVYGLCCSWQPTSLVNVPIGRNNSTAIWTGAPLNKMIVWGGHDMLGNVQGDGGRFNPITNSWSSVPISMVNAPSPRTYHTAIWTGAPLNKMIVWGGYDLSGSFLGLGDGAIYDPVANSWTTMSTATGTPPSARMYHTAIWTGAPLNKMIVWGGYGGTLLLGDGAIYDPVANSWTTMSTATGTSPSARMYHTAIWTGAPLNKMIVWGGDVAGIGLAGDGAMYDPVANSWTAVSMTNAPQYRRGHTAVWTGTKMIIYGGEDTIINPGNITALGDGGQYDPVANSWTAITPSTPGEFHVAHWTGSKMIVWGGNYYNNDSYDPISDTWTPLCPATLSLGWFASVWTGSQFVVWSGYGANNPSEGAMLTP